MWYIPPDEVYNFNIHLQTVYVYCWPKWWPMVAIHVYTDTKCIYNKQSWYACRCCCKWRSILWCWWSDFGPLWTDTVAALFLNVGRWLGPNECPVCGYARHSCIQRACRVHFITVKRIGQVEVADFNLSLVHQGRFSEVDTTLVGQDGSMVERWVDLWAPLLGLSIVIVRLAHAVS